MIPTPFAETLAEPIAYALGAIYNSLNATSRFEPATSTRAFTIAMTDIGEIYFLPTLMRRLARDAPGVTVSTVRNHADTLRDEMEAGRVDLAIGFLPDLKSGFFQRRLFRQRYVCLFRKGHPLAKRGMTMEGFLEAEHVSIVAEGTGHGMVDATILRAGLPRRVSLHVPHFIALGHILQSTDLIAVVPQAYATRTLAVRPRHGRVSGQNSGHHHQRALARAQPPRAREPVAAAVAVRDLCDLAKMRRAVRHAGGAARATASMMRWLRRLR